MDPETRRMFIEEVSVLCQINFPNVVKFYGAVTKVKRMMVFDLCKENLEDKFTRAALTSAELNTMATGIAAGLRFLHSREPPMIHRDIKPANILLDPSGKPMLSDFGLTCVVPKSRVAMQICGTPYYMAPEIWVSNPEYNEKVDVYAYGVTIYEVATRNPLYPGYTNVFDIGDAVRSGKRPPTPSTLSANTSRLVTACWHADAAQRPEMGRILQYLQSNPL
eukprot:TRINITY_DN1747_c1_g1_i4.p1 TRINITY_DN1747_c1_g1~~TRINITY_DN1747_c1_g1_i4.p1  ORF type:complete len:257 (-),score=59.27 TRINITY_DN1747_c1_g1_i4:10-672(-)